MVSVTFISTILAVAAVASAGAHDHGAPNHGNVNLRAIQEKAAELQYESLLASGHQPKRANVPRNKLSKRCNPPKSSLVSSAAHSTSTSSAAKTSTTSSSSTSVVILSTTSSTPEASTTTEAKTTSKASPTSTSSSAASTTTSSSSSSSGSGHLFTFTNKCSYSVNPTIADTSCGYSPRCPAASFSTEQPASLAAGATSTVSVPDGWVGRVFNQNGSCGAKGEDCTMLEFNLDTGSMYTPQAYDISNIQGFTQSISVSADGCDTVTCTSASCSCENAYPVGDMSGCGNDLPVKACGAGNIGFSVVFCP